MAIASAVVLLAGTTACKNKPKSEDIIVAKYVPEAIQAPIKLPTDNRTTSVKWLDKNYVVTISRQASDSLAKIEDERGQQYVDNRVTVKVLRADESVFFKKVFTKEAFASYIDPAFRQKGILENIVFHEVDNQQLKFGVVVSRPENDDEFVPLDMWIDRNGGIMIKPGKLFDNTTEGEEEGV
jgi:hypothetical protein